LRIYAGPVSLGIKEENMPYRVVKEVLIMFCVIGGSAIGWAAGHHTYGSGTPEMIGAFLGMALAGGFADLCLQHRRR